MHTFLVTFHVVLCVLLVLVVMLQSGKGAEVSASFSGSSQTVFGSSGGANFFTRFTQAVAALFMVTSILLTISANRGRQSVVEGMANAATTAPAAAVPPAQSASPATSGTAPQQQGTQPPADQPPAAGQSPVPSTGANPTPAATVTPFQSAAPAAAKKAAAKK